MTVKDAVYAVFERQHNRFIVCNPQYADSTNFSIPFNALMFWVWELLGGENQTQLTWHDLKDAILAMGEKNEIGLGWGNLFAYRYF